MGFLTGILIGGITGFLAGVILTCILLCKKNLEAYTRISNKTQDSAVNNFKAMKTVYKQAIDEYEYGTPAPSYEENEEHKVEDSDNDEYAEE